jgi:hypothetical protein
MVMTEPAITPPRIAGFFSAANLDCFSAHHLVITDLPSGGRKRITDQYNTTRR